MPTHISGPDAQGVHALSKCPPPAFTWLSWWAIPALALLITGCSSGSQGSVSVNVNDGGVTAGDASSDSSNTSETLSPPACTTASDCTEAVSEPCQSYVCDTAQGICVIGTFPDGMPCDDGDSCTADETCSSGVCSGGTPAPPACAGASCGTDACGNTCGTCPDDSTCTGGQCIEAPDPDVLSCANVTYEGCCTASGALVWCENDAITTIDCSENPSCGWAADTSFYNCGIEDETPDPAGTNPYLCPGEVCETSCDTVACGYACGELCGECPTGNICLDGACVECTCDGLACGTNACGESCGTCEPGLTCTDGECVDDPCFGISFEGCCDGDLVRYCESGALKQNDCSENPSCGWSTTDEFYNCGTDGAAEPTDAFPIECPAVCEPTCADENPCGDDGCGGSCGECAEGETCSSSGQCEAASLADATADTSAEDDTWADAETSVGPEPDATVTADGTGDATDITTSDTATSTEDTVSDVSVCTPDCTDKLCGDDGCGASCGTCAEGSECVAGACQGTCTSVSADDTSCDGIDDDCDGETDEDCSQATTYTEHTQPILAAKCGDCHTMGSSGGHSIGSTYAAGNQDSYHCTGLTVAECALVRILDGTMPVGKDCGGPVADDSLMQSECVTVSEYATLEAWADDGYLE